MIFFLSIRKIQLICAFNRYMDHISVKKYHKTSVSIRETSFRRIKAALIILARNGVYMSEQKLIRLLLGEYLKSIRGAGGKAESARRYNIDGAKYVRRAAYFNHGLYGILWQRSAHRGESISRMLDFAIRTYLPQLVECWLNVPPLVPRVTQNTPYWRERHCNRFLRKKIYYAGFLTYASHTQRQDKSELIWGQQTEFQRSIYRPIRVSSRESPFFYLGLTR